jgi:hypothetical protein
MLGQHRAGGRVEEHAAGGQPERHRVDGDQVLVDQGEDGGQGYAPQVGGDQYPDPGESVDDRAGQRGQQQHRGDFGDDGAGDAKAGAGQPEHQHHQGNGAEGVAPPGNCLGDKEAPVGGLG